MIHLNFADLVHNVASFQKLSRRNVCISSTNKYSILTPLSLTCHLMIKMCIVREDLKLNCSTLYDYRHFHVTLTRTQSRHDQPICGCVSVIGLSLTLE